MDFHELHNEYSRTYVRNNIKFIVKVYELYTYVPQWKNEIAVIVISFFTIVSYSTTIVSPSLQMWIEPYSPVRHSLTPHIHRSIVILTLLYTYIEYFTFTYKQHTYMRIRVLWIKPTTSPFSSSRAVLNSTYRGALQSLLSCIVL